VDQDPATARLHPAATAAQPKKEKKKVSRSGWFNLFRARYSNTSTGHVPRVINKMHKRVRG
jgi:hypothetical protein